MDFDLDIFNSLTNNRLAPVPEEQTEELLKAIEFPMIGSMDTSSMQDIMTVNSSNAQQSVIQGANPMRQQAQPGTNSLLYTATIYSQDMSVASHNNQQQQMMSMQQNRQQQNESSNQAMMSDLNPFISGSLGIRQQQAQVSEQMMPQNDLEDKDGYKNKYSRGYSRPQLP